jgi:alpha-amylase
MLQAFYWNCPQLENQEHNWWQYLNDQMPTIKKAGFTSIWLPPPSKAATDPSMGYNIYDYFDLGEFNQKGTTKTWFGSKQELIDLVKTAHEYEIDVYADIVINHNSGGDEEEENPIDKEMHPGTNRKRWTKFIPKSEKFRRDWKCFHPSPYERYDDSLYGDMPDLCHRNPYVLGNLLKYVRWLVEEIGFDGYRYDFVKGYGSWMATSIQDLRVRKNGKYTTLFGVGECWGDYLTIKQWLTETNMLSDNPACAFDFPLHYRLKDLCDAHGYSLKELGKPGTVCSDSPLNAVTFVDDHDTDDKEPIINNKNLAYAYILTHEGYPCVFWKDYFNYHLAKENTPNGIEALIKIHEQYAGGATTLLYVDDDLYIMQRSGTEKQEGLIFVLNNRGDAWNGHWVNTKWQNVKLTPKAWGTNIPNIEAPIEKWTQSDGSGEFYAPPRGYAVYVPQYQ